MRSGTLAAALLAATLSVAAAARAQVEPPPAGGESQLPGARSMYVLDVPFLHFGPMDLAPLAAGNFGVAFETAYGNTFSHTWHATAIADERHEIGQAFSRENAEELHRRHPHDHITFLDADVTRFALTGRLGITDHLGIAVEVPFISYGALHLDRFIENFHRTVGLAEFAREFFPRDRFLIVRQRPEGALEFDDRIPSSGLGDIVLRPGYRGSFADGTRYAVELAVKAPTGSADDYRGSGAWDVGLLAGASRRFFASKRLGLHLEAGLVRPGNFRGDVPTTFRVWSYARVLVGADLRIGRATYLSLAAVREESPFKHDDLDDASRPAVEITLGLAREIGRHLRASLAVTENTPYYGDAADLALTLRLAFHP